MDGGKKLTTRRKTASGQDCKLEGARSKDTVQLPMNAVCIHSPIIHPVCCEEIFGKCGAIYNIKIGVILGARYCG